MTLGWINGLLNPFYQIQLGGKDKYGNGSSYPLHFDVMKTFQSSK